MTDCLLQCPCSSGVMHGFFFYGHSTPFLSSRGITIDFRTSVMNEIFVPQVFIMLWWLKNRFFSKSVFLITAWSYCSGMLIRFRCMSVYVSVPWWCFYVASIVVIVRLEICPLLFYDGRVHEAVSSCHVTKAAHWLERITDTEC